MRRHHLGNYFLLDSGFSWWVAVPPDWSLTGRRGAGPQPVGAAGDVYKDSLPPVRKPSFQSLAFDQQPADWSATLIRQLLQACETKKSSKMMTRGLLVISLVSLCMGRILADASSREDHLDDINPATGSGADLFKEQVADDQVDSSEPEAAISVSRRSPLDKNFIRFGRFGPKATPMDTARLTSAGELEGDGGANGRSSRGLSSNFIRFGRSFDPYRLRDLILKVIEEQEKQTEQTAAYQRMERSLASNFLRFGRSIH